MNINTKQLDEFEAMLISRGYKRFAKSYQSEDYGYWKSFDITYDADGEARIGYQIGFLVYDFGKYPMNESPTPISVAFEFVNGNTDTDEYPHRLALGISDTNMTGLHFEEICAKFYNLIRNGFLK